MLKSYLKGKDAWKLAKQAYKGVYYLKGLVNAEKKFADLTANGTTDYNGIVLDLTAVAQGDTESSRNGNSIYVRGILLNINYNMNTAATYSLVKTYVFIDNEPNGTPPTASDILENAGTVYAPQSQIKFPEARTRFKILKVGTFNLSNAGAIAKNLKWYINLRHHTKFTGINATDEGKGHIYVMMISDRTPDSNEVGYAMVNRTYFYDN